VTRGFWAAIGDLAIHEAWVVAPVREAFPIGEGVEALPLDEALARPGCARTSAATASSAGLSSLPSFTALLPPTS
jgi:hypothetical protein